MHTHHRAPRFQRRARVLSSRPRTARATEHRITTAPDCHDSSSFEVVSTRVRCPVTASAFSLIAVRELLWKGAGQAVRAKGDGRVFMEMDCPFFCPDQRDMTAQIICGGLIR
ncbi:hypothetical protein [Alicycliphilus denitrificans]|uniref:hypothetical protein n=1 Tax=Alicycliphilus denitrificans TaxID=179636 RepID=UPI0011C35A15|nr:hypothetical protein [Alicycliphilus denitrificans]